MIFKGVINKQAATSPRPLRCRYRTSNSCSLFFEFHSHFYALFIGCSSKEEGNYFKWIVISSLVLSLTFHLKANDCVGSNFVYCLHMLMRDASLKQRIPCTIRISSFGAFSAGKKCAFYTCKYGKQEHYELSSI